MIISTDMWTITPNVAAKLLENNPSNRPVSRTKVAEYIRQLLNGEWQTTHQGILLGKGDILLDGQHRLLAIVECGVAVKCLVSRDDERTSPVDLMVDAGLRRISRFAPGAGCPDHSHSGHRHRPGIGRSESGDGKRQPAQARGAADRWRRFGK